MTADPLVVRLRTALTAAMRARDTTAVSALRTALGAVANAEAVEVDPTGSLVTSPHVAGAHSGLGAAEAARRELAEPDVRAVVEAEVADRLTAADELDALGHPDRAAVLRHEADVLRAALDT